jgi:NAD(P)-dependent dehydrogenase (short-subunit alcohol dehydrogenase family)
MGARVILPARDRARGERAVAEIGASKGSAEVVVGDLSSRKSTRSLAETILRAAPKIDVLVNNAGMWTTERQESPEGFELIWATNVLGPFLLTQELAPGLAAAGNARVVNVSSVAAGKLDLDDVEWKKRPWSGFDAYQQSKQALRMLTWSFSEKLAAQRVTVNTVSPGFVRTGLNDTAKGPLAAVIRFSSRFMASTPQDGADAATWLAASPEVSGVTGKFYREKRNEVPCQFRAPEPRARLFDLCASMVAS